MCHGAYQIKGKERAKNFTLHTPLTFEIVQTSMFYIELSTKIVGKLLIMICMIPTLNLGVGEMGFMFCDLHVFLNNPSSGVLNSMMLPCLTSILPGDTSDSRNSSNGKIDSRKFIIT